MCRESQIRRDRENGQDRKTDSRNDFSFDDSVPLAHSTLGGSLHAMDATNGNFSISFMDTKSHYSKENHTFLSLRHRQGSSNSFHFHRDLKQELPPKRPSSYDKMYYIYPLGEEFWWRWPKNGSGCDTNDNGYIDYGHSELSGYMIPVVTKSMLFLSFTHFFFFCLSLPIFLHFKVSVDF